MRAGEKTLLPLVHLDFLLFSIFSFLVPVLLSHHHRLVLAVGRPVAIAPSHPHCRRQIYNKAATSLVGFRLDLGAPESMEMESSAGVATPTSPTRSTASSASCLPTSEPAPPRSQHGP